MEAKYTLHGPDIRRGDSELSIRTCCKEEWHDTFRVKDLDVFGDILCWSRQL